MYTEGGAFLVTLSGQPRSRAAGSHVALGRGPVCPGAQARRGWSYPCQRMEKSLLTGGSAAVPRSPLQSWKHQLHPCGGMVAVLCQPGCWHGAEATAGPSALKPKQTCFELFPSLLVPPNETSRCLSSFRLSLKAQSCQLLAAPVSRSDTPPLCHHRPGAGPAAHNSAGTCFS